MVSQVGRYNHSSFPLTGGGYSFGSMPLLVGCPPALPTPLVFLSVGQVVCLANLSARISISQLEVLNSLTPFIPLCDGCAPQLLLINYLGSLSKFYRFDPVIFFFKLFSALRDSHLMLYSLNYFYPSDKSVMAKTRSPPLLQTCFQSVLQSWLSQGIL